MDKKTDQAQVMTAEERLIEAGYDDVMTFTGYTYDDALVGVTEDNRAVYDYDKMVAWLMEKEGWSMEDAAEWIEYNTIRALDYAGPEAPVVMTMLR